MRQWDGRWRRLLPVLRRAARGEGRAGGWRLVPSRRPCCPGQLARAARSERGTRVSRDQL